MNHPLLSIAIFVLASLIWGSLIAATLLCIFYRRRVTPKRHLFSELKEGMDALASTRGEPPPMPKMKPSREHCINCGLNVDPVCACERGRKLAHELSERDRVQYEFLGQTGFEE